MKNFDPEVIKGLRDKYSDIHPLIFHRSLERSSCQGDLFDILESLPKIYPIVWDEDKHSWVHTSDILQSKIFDLGKRPCSK